MQIKTSSEVNPKSLSNFWGAYHSTGGDKKALANKNLVV